MTETTTDDTVQGKLAPKAKPTKTAAKAATKQADTTKLMTKWAADERLNAPEDFGEDQAAVHSWIEAPEEMRMDALQAHMTLADAEELIATAKHVAIEHSRRAERASNLVTIVAARLGRQAEALNAIDPTTIGKAVPVATEPKPAPTATRKMELPSAL